MDDVLSVHAQLRMVVGLIGVTTAAAVAAATDKLLAGAIVGVLVVSYPDIVAILSRQRGEASEPTVTTGKEMLDDHDT